MRNWHVKGLSVRPVHRMIAHSAFIIVARRLADVVPEMRDETAVESDQLQTADPNVDEIDDDLNDDSDNPDIDPTED
jgi:tRNA (adenine57-N1/adenine58-N1)-methyltransferase catalytic subunit